MADTSIVKAPPAGASLPATPGLALLDAGAASRVLVLNVSGVGDTEAYDTVGITALSEILGGESDGDFVVGDGAGAVQLASEAPAAVRAIIGAAAIPTAGVDASRPTATVATLGALYTATDTGVRYVCESDGSGGARWAVQGARGQEGRDTTAVQCAATVYGTTTETITGNAILSYALVFSMRSAPSSVQNLFVHSGNSGTDGTQVDIGRDAGDRYLLGVYRYGFGTPQVYLTGATISGSPTTLHCIAVTLDGATVRYSLDGAAVQTVSNGTGAASVNTGVARLGGSMGATALADAWMTSLVAWSTAVGDSDLAIVSGAARAAGSTPGRIPAVAGATEIARWHAGWQRAPLATEPLLAGSLGGSLTWSAAPTLVIR